MHIETQRTVIRDFVSSDAADLQEILGDGQTMEYCEPPYDMEKTARFLRQFCTGKNGGRAVALRDSGKVIGYLLFCETEPEVYEIGWFFNRRYWRQGYAYEACSALVEYAFSVLHARRLFAETIDGEKSLGLMRKLGMRPEGVRRVREAQGQWVDWYLYGLSGR